MFPHLFYYNYIWSTTYPHHLYTLNTLHMKIIRIMTNSDFLHSIGTHSCLKEPPFGIVFDNM